MPAPSAPDATIEGTLERVVFKGEDSGYTVARFTPSTGKVPVTVVGHLVEIQEGVPYTLHGVWVDDRKWGRQFKVSTFTQIVPKTALGIEKYLSSGMIPGIGVAYAKRIVTTF